MFGNSDDVFANIPREHHPDRSSPSPAPEAHVPAMPPGMHYGGGPAPDGMGMPRYMPMNGPIEMLEPVDTSNGAAVRTAGITALVTAVTIGGGLALGGPWGAVAGFTGSSTLFNGYRAQKWWGSADPSEKHEAVVSALFAALGLGGFFYSAYQAYQARKDDE